MPSYAGATYQWTDASGNILSNTRNYTFASYSAANDGVYTCKIFWIGGCITRYVNVTLNSELCGQPLTVVNAVDDINQTPQGIPVSGNLLINDTNLTTVTGASFNGTPVSIGSIFPTLSDGTTIRNNHR